MTDPTEQLVVCVRVGDPADLANVLAAGADPNADLTGTGWRPLHSACSGGHLPCTKVLLQAGADPNAADSSGRRPLHCAAHHGDARCILALLAAGADPFAVDSRGNSALHVAAERGAIPDAAVLLEAAPQLALLANRAGQRPLEAAFAERQWDVAYCLLEHGPLQPAGEVLAALAAPDWVPSSLYAPLAARQPLTPNQWARVPAPCPGLGAALPAVLARSEAEAALLVQHLPLADRERLRTAALCLRRSERVHAVALPPAILRALLLVAVD